MSHAFSSEVKGIMVDWLFVFVAITIYMVYRGFFPFLRLLRYWFNKLTGRVRVWADGCYDVGHFGHANNLRQAKALGKYLIVGVHSDKEIFKHKKCFPVFDEKERYEMIRAIKWVDEVVEGAPYVTTPEILDKHNASFCSHGNDITTTADGTDTYKIVKDAGRYKEVERTRGVSTTGIIERILSIGQPTRGSNPSGYTGATSQLHLTIHKIQQFCHTQKERKKSDRVVYVSGAFDIFHPGHIRFLEKAAAEGNYLIVGVHDDETVRSYKGSDYPILGLRERLLSLSACKYVDDVVIGAPYSVTKDFMDEFNVDVVAQGHLGHQNVAKDPFTGEDPYEVPKKLNKFKILESGSDLTTEDIVLRVQDRREEFEARNAEKHKNEDAIIRKKQETQEENNNNINNN